ncbi:50S ribosomal protein L3 [Candidatus Tremblaya princeps]|uniref:50S ribosomal protein L3 n=1 Tax=Tremblaya princeps TaxID=189385 RepID=A0A143WP07_TREPR|nr:50S ribosomal protein L3 [Candidatus Tremblaya princeps]
MRGCILLGVKVGMTRMVCCRGGVVPVTILDTSGNTAKRVGCLRMLYRSTSRLRLRRPQMCACLGLNLEPAAYMARSARHDQPQCSSTQYARLHAGALVRVGQLVSVRSRTAGKGFSGAMKRHGFSSGRASHGSSLAHRTPGSTGMSQDPGRVFPGKRMPGRMGYRHATARNLTVEHVAHDIVMVRGGTPGHAGSIVAILP